MTPMTLASDVLAAAATAISDAGHEPPARQYVAHGTPAGDLCEELVVWVDPITDPQIVPNPTVGLYQAGIFVALTRCVPTWTRDDPIPDADVLNASAVDLGEQAWAMWVGLRRAQRALFERCETVRFDQMVPQPPSGGFGTWVGGLRVTLTPDPYTPGAS